MKDYFELFGLPPAFRLDPGLLEQRWREVAAAVHPDRYAHASDAERRAALQWSAHANEAYRVLRDPVERARYLLERAGAAVAAEGSAGLGTEFLARQMELREALEEARARGDRSGLEQLGAELARERAALEASLEEALDRSGDTAAAAALVRRLMFYERMDAELREVVAAHSAR